MISIDSPSTKRKQTLILFGKRFTLSPFKRQYGTSFKIRSIRPDTILISIMFANNEIGTIEPIKEIGEIAKKHDIFFNTDAVQAFGHIAINVDEMHIDMLSASGHKFHGPKGIGFFYMRDTVKIGPLIHGGAQERSRRAGTHNVPGIVGIATAAKSAYEDLDQENRMYMQIRLNRRFLSDRA